ncbi:unnamed protein product [Cuscuta campestris]|uniref:Uncharacterized protein n=1 Tax=Cuscuta campestris TaxID=132261 RepID=A0A484K736_9ASTE|nr:unnamed protein product [Cuscuta campestris]
MHQSPKYPPKVWNPSSLEQSSIRGHESFADRQDTKTGGSQALMPATASTYPSALLGSSSSPPILKYRAHNPRGHHCQNARGSLSRTTTA